MTRRRIIAAFVKMLVPYVLAAVVGGAVVWFGLAAPRLRSRAPAVNPLRSSPSDYRWSAQPAPVFPMPPYARFLEDVQIVLDPGHGGRADRKGWKRGPTGLREAQVNLRVALLLRDFLQQAGARVVLTRDSDVYLDPDDGRDLRARVAIANQLAADVFLSIHHNGADKSPEANYTSVFYHATPDHSPPSLDVARCLLAGLNDALRIDQHLGCALVSDYAIYPGRGFAVLREAQVPAVLSEASFHSNAREELRLRDPVYNRREAYGLFLGLARWAQGGLPRVRLIEPADGRVRAGKSIVVELDDGLSGRGGFGASLPQVQEGTLVVEVGGRPAPHKVDVPSRRLEIGPIGDINALKEGLYVSFANVFGQHVLHPRIKLKLGEGD